MKVIVLGAGTIGVVTAYFLARAGHQVTVIDKNSQAAMGCSYANGSQLSYCHIETWAGETSFLSLVGAALNPRSFLSLSGFNHKEFYKWLWQFYKNSFSLKSKQNSKKLLELSLHSKKVLQQIIKDENIEFDYKEEGTLHFYNSKKQFEQAKRKAKKNELLGCKSQILTAQECIKKEPTLVKIFDQGKLAGGIFYEMDASGNSFIFTQKLAKICQEKYGVTFSYDNEIKNIFTNHKKITGINTIKGVFTANKYVYALGAKGNSLLKGIKVNLGIYPIRGYSLSIKANNEFMAPKMALTDSKNKMVYSRIGDIFRVAGTVEICSLNDIENKKHFSFLRKIVKKTFSSAGNFNEIKEWSEFRPCMPDSIPVISKVEKLPNLLINSGHGSLGWTLACGSGKKLSDLVSSKS